MYSSFPLIIHCCKDIATRKKQGTLDLFRYFYFRYSIFFLFRSIAIIILNAHLFTDMIQAKRERERESLYSNFYGWFPIIQIFIETRKREGAKEKGQNEKIERKEEYLNLLENFFTHKEFWRKRRKSYWNFCLNSNQLLKM